MNSEETFFSLSRPAKEALKTALSITIAIAIALAMDWEKPHWAAFAVAFMSLSSEGQSLNRGAMRMLGTLVAIIAAFVFLACFPQDRWLFIGAVSVYIGCCAYMMTGKKRQYFWYASGFICTVIAADSHDSLSSFQIAVERAQETGTGIFVHSIVTSLLWPLSARDSLEKSSRQLLDAQRKLFEGYRGRLGGEKGTNDLRAVRLQSLPLLEKVEQQLAAAEVDSYQVWELRHHWKNFHSLARSLTETLGHLCTCLPELATVDVDAAMPNLDAFQDEIERRFVDAGDLLEGKPVGRSPRVLSLEVDESFLKSLSPLRAAAVETAASDMRHLEKCSRAILQCAQALQGSPLPNVQSLASTDHRRTASIDPDRLLGVATVLGVYWISFLISVYVPDIPGGASFWQMSTLFAMLTIRTNSDPLFGVAIPSTLGSVFGGLFYVSVMPHLATYGQLGLFIFLWVFAVAHRFSEPPQAGLKASLIANFISNMSIHNEQTYSFAAFANGLLMTVLACAVLVAVFYLPPSPRPEKAFVRLYRRLFRHAHPLVTKRLDSMTGPLRLASRLRTRFYQSDVGALPGKLSACSHKIDYRCLPANTIEQVQDLISSLYDLAFQIRDMVEMRTLAQAELSEGELLDDLRAWHDNLEDRLRGRSQDITQSRHSIALGDLLATELERLEARMELCFAQSTEDERRTAERRRLFRLLGSYRSLAEAEIGTAKVAERIDWPQWQEDRF